MSGDRNIDEDPRGTLIAGFGNGFLGLWDLATGTLLDSTQLHVPVVHFLPDGSDLHALTELGDYHRWDLSDFHKDYEELLEEVRREVPLVWRGGMAVPADEAIAP